MSPIPLPIHQSPHLSLNPSNALVLTIISLGLEPLARTVGGGTERDFVSPPFFLEGVVQLEAKVAFLFGLASEVEQDLGEDQDCEGRGGGGGGERAGKEVRLTT